jgi:tripartite ATP-independent transporter DctP family solute receptor
MKKRMVAVALLVAFVTLGVQMASAMEKKGESIILKAACDHAKGYSTVEGLELMSKLVKEWTKGRVVIEVYPGAVLGSEKETIEQTQMGIIDINRVSISPVTAVYPKISVFSLPYIFKNRDHMWKVLESDLGQQMLLDLQEVGFLGIGYMDAGARSFYSVKKAIYSPSDIKGLKVRVQRSPVMIDMINALGGKAVPMAFEEVYTALQTGVIDAAENNPPSYLETSHYEVAKYYSLDEHAMVPEVVLMSKRTWDQLSDADRQIIRMVAIAGQELQRKLWLKDEDIALSKVKAAGCTIIEPEKGPFIEAMKPIYDKYGAQYMELIKQIQDMAK